MATKQEAPKAAVGTEITRNDEIERLLMICLATPLRDPNLKETMWGVPVIYWGPPGIGKSERIEAAGTQLGLGTGTVYLATIQPEEIGGAYVQDGKGGITLTCPLPQVQELIAAKRGVLFLDELSCARPAVQGAGLGVIRERVIAGKRLPSHIRVVAAANPPEDAAGGWALTPPLANRFVHFEVGSPSGTEWAKHQLGNDPKLPSMAGIEERVIDQWGHTYAKVNSLVTGFISRNERLLYVKPPEGHPARGRAWASPRTWDLATRLMTTASILGMPELAPSLLAAAVGQGPVVEWLEYVSGMNLPDPAEMLEHGWTPDKRRLDIAIVAYNAAVSFALSTPDVKERRARAIKAWRLLDTAYTRHGLSDVILPAGSTLMRAGFSIRNGADIEAVASNIISMFGDSSLASYVT